MRAGRCCSETSALTLPPTSPSFERLLLHALCQYMDLVSASKSLLLWGCFSLPFITISPLQLSLFLSSSSRPHLVLQLTDKPLHHHPPCPKLPEEPWLWRWRWVGSGAEAAARVVPRSSPAHSRHFLLSVLGFCPKAGGCSQGSFSCGPARGFPSEVSLPGQGRRGTRLSPRGGVSAAGAFH